MKVCTVMTFDVYCKSVHIVVYGYSTGYTSIQKQDIVVVVCAEDISLTDERVEGFCVSGVVRYHKGATDNGQRLLSKWSSEKTQFVQ